MPLVEVPEHGLVDFPDHMDDTAIASAIKGQSSPESAPPLTPERSADVQKFLRETPYPGDEYANQVKGDLSKASEWAQTTPGALKIPDPSNEGAAALAEMSDVSGIHHLLKAAMSDEHYKSLEGASFSGAAHLVNSLMTPLGVATLGTGSLAKGAVGKAAAIGFGLYQLAHNPEQLKAIWNASNFDERAHRVADLLIGDTAAAFGFKHGLSGDAKLSPAPVEAQPSETAPMAERTPVDAVPSPVETPGKVTQLLNQRQKTTDPVERQRLWDEAKAAETPAEMKKGGGESGALNMDVLKDAVKEYAEGLAEHAKGVGKLAGAAGRLIATKEQRDKIPALYDAAETQAGYVANQAGKSVKLESESPLARKAATFIQQSAGDRAGMEAKLDAIQGKGYDDIIDYAKAHWGDLEKVAAKAQEHTDTAHAEALKSGMDLAYREGYVKGAYEQYEPQNRKVVFGQTKGGGVGSSFRNEKHYNDYAEAIAAGEKPSTLDLADLTQSAVLQSMRAVNRRNWVDALGSMPMPDGRPVTLPPEKIPRRDSAGNVASPGLGAPKGYQLVDIGGGMAAVHEDVAPLVDALVSPSKFPKWMAQLAGGVKHNILAFDIYHGSRFGQMQMAMMRQKTPSYRKGLATMEYADADLAKAVKSGEITQGQADYALANRPIIEGGIRNGANIGRISDALYKDVAPLWPGATATTKFIFNKLSRGIMAESYVYMFKRNQGLHPAMGAEALHRLTAKELNTYYRNLGNQGVLKNKTFQDISRFMLLAPQWFEGRITSEAKGYGQLAKSAVTLKKPGNAGAAVGTGLVAYFAINQMINMATRGQPTWENPEPGHKMDAWIPDPMGSSGQFVSPLSVFAETTHDVHKMHERGVSMLDVPGDIAGSQLGPIPRTVWDVATGRDFYGQKLYGLDRFLQAGLDISPAPLGLKGQNSAGAWERKVLSFAGIKSVGAGTASSNAYKLADTWMRKHGVKRPGAQEGETGPASIYRPLRNALEVGDIKAAKKELAELRRTTDPDLIDRHFGNLDNVRFTGRKSTEDDFIASLRAKERRIYDRAILERQRVMDRYDRIK